jgi:peptidoglycan/xylan/chitin deacetylase (PgdA/CDA1 family)
MQVHKLIRAARSLRQRLARRALILQYHRVTQLASDPYLLAVTPEHFAEHLSVLRKAARPVRLSRLFSELSAAKGLAVVVTFDDGYYDAFSEAKPLLERYNIPATVFVASGFIDSKREFWWDELEKILLQPGTLPPRLCLEVNGRTHHWQLDEAKIYSEEDFCRHRSWNYGEKIDPTSRHSVFRSLYQLLQALPNEERSPVIAKLAAWAGTELAVRPSHRSVSSDELVQLKTDDIEIGAHTVTHPVLSKLSSAAQRREIRGSKADLEERLGCEIQSFSYPHGLTSHYTSDSVSLVRETGYTYACSSSKGCVGADSDRLELPRFVVTDCDGDTFARQLEHWYL